MAPQEKSQIWFIENVKTGRTVFLNVGQLSIGRKPGNDIRVGSKSNNYCSKIHCILSLHEGCVKLLNRVSLLIIKNRTHLQTIDENYISYRIWAKHRQNYAKK